MRQCHKRIDVGTISMLSLCSCTFTIHAQPPPPGPLLRLEWRSNVLDLVVDSLSSTGALYLLRAAELGGLSNSPTVLTVTNTPQANGLRLSLGLSGSLTNQAFFSAVHYTNLAFIPAGSFTMGNCMDPGEGESDELPLHTVYVSAFCMDRYEVTKALWDEV